LHAFVSRDSPIRSDARASFEVRTRVVRIDASTERFIPQAKELVLEQTLGNFDFSGIPACTPGLEARSRDRCSASIVGSGSITILLSGFDPGLPLEEDVELKLIFGGGGKGKAPPKVWAVGSATRAVPAFKFPIQVTPLPGGRSGSQIRSAIPLTDGHASQIEDLRLKFFGASANAGNRNAAFVPSCKAPTAGRVNGELIFSIAERLPAHGSLVLACGK
jgi:hypothetical protein